MLPLRDKVFSEESLSREKQPYKANSGMEILECVEKKTAIRGKSHVPEEGNGERESLNGMPKMGLTVRGLGRQKT